jgi:cell division protein FtsQ
MSSSVNEIFEPERQVNLKTGPLLKRIRSSLLIMSLIIVSMTGAVMTLLKPDFMPIRKVRVEGEFQHLAPDRLQALVTDTVRGGFFNVNVDSIQKVLLLNPWVYQVNVLRNWPDGLTVQVLEHLPVARWGEHGLINVEGDLFSPEPDTYPDALPVLHGPGETYRQMLDQYRKLQSMLDATSLSIDRLTLNDRRSWSLHLADGPLLILGRNNIQNRMARFIAFMQSGTGGYVPDIEQVDLRYTNGFAVRWKYNSNYFELGQQNNG